MNQGGWHQKTTLYPWGGAQDMRQNQNVIDEFKPLL